MSVVLRKLPLALITILQKPESPTNTRNSFSLVQIYQSKISLNMGASSSAVNGLVWHDVKDRPLWTASLKWNTSNKEVWPIFDYKPGVHQYNPEKWPGKVILVDTWVKIIDKNMSEIRRAIRLGDGDIERTKNTLSVLSGLLVEKWPLNFGPDAKSFLKQPKKPVDPKRPTSSILSLPETPQIITVPNSFHNSTDNDTHQSHLEALNSSTAIGNTTEDSMAKSSMRSADKAQNKNQQSTVTKQASISHRSPSHLLVRLKLPTKLRSALPSVSPPQPSAASRSKQPAATTKKDAESTLNSGEPGAIKATATQSLNGQSLQTLPQDIPRLSGGLLDSYVAFETSVRLVRLTWILLVTDI